MYKEILKQIMDLENNLIFKYTNIVLISEQDMNFILELPEDTQKEIIRRIKANIDQFRDALTDDLNLGDADICPHCVYSVIKHLDCVDCPYGKNNGVCHNYGIWYGDLYGRIRDELRSNDIHRIWDIIGIRDALNDALNSSEV